MGTVIKKYRIKLVLLVMLLVLTIGVAAPPPTYSNGYPALNDYADWSVLWWQWAYTQPWPTNPVWDTSVSAPYAGLNQKGPVWFLAGHFDKTLIDNFPVVRGSATNPINIPKNTALFFPVVDAANVNGIEVKDADGNILISIDPEATIRKVSADYIDSCTKIVCTLDGTPVIFNPNTPIVRTQTSIFNITLPNNNVLDHIYWDFYNYSHVPAGDWDQSVADGYYVMLPPLTPGGHVIHFEAYIGDDMIQNVTYYVATPLPGTLLLLGSGWLFLFGLGKKRIII